MPAKYSGSRSHGAERSRIIVARTRTPYKRDAADEVLWFNKYFKLVREPPSDSSREREPIIYTFAVVFPRRNSPVWYYGRSIASFYPPLPKLYLPHGAIKASFLNNLMFFHIE